MRLRDVSITGLFLQTILCLLPTIIVASSSRRSPSPLWNKRVVKRDTRPFQTTSKSILESVELLRGGSTKTPSSAKPPSSSDAQNLNDKHVLEQTMLLQARSARLREVLTQRGVFQDYTTIDAPTTPQPVDWDCVMSTVENPKRCLYSWDAEPNTKVVAPAGTDEWISLSSLNRLRRSDPSKVEGMWHNKYAIFSSWFQSGGSAPYSMYQHLPWQGFMLSLLLDIQFAFNLTIMMGMFFVLAVTRSVWEGMLNVFLTSPFLWTRFPSWGKYMHAPLPFKIVMGQMAWSGLALVYKKLQNYVRENLIQMESRIWEESIPLTDLTGVEDDVIVEENGGIDLGSHSSSEDEGDDDDDDESDY